MLDDDSMADEDAEGETSTMQMEADMDLSDLGAESDPDEAPNISPDESGRIRMDVNYQAFTTEFDEMVRAEELCDAEELTRLRAMLDQQLVSLQHATSKLANRLQRAPDGEAEPLVGVRSRRGNSRRVAARASSSPTR